MPDAPITLIQHLLMSNEPMVTSVGIALLQNSAVLDDLLFVNNSSLRARVIRFTDNLPEVSWAKLNENLTRTSGSPTVYEESAYIMRNRISVDNVLLKDKNVVNDPRVITLQAYLANINYEINDRFINNDHVTGDVDAFVGLRYRLDNPTTYQLASENKINANALALDGSNLTAANANLLIEYIDQAMHQMGAQDGNNICIYMNETMERRLARAVRVLGAGAGWNMTTDAFGRRVTMFRNAKVKIIGRKSDQTTQIITSTETAAGIPGSSNHTSIYFVRHEPGQFYAWQMSNLEVIDLGRLGSDGHLFNTFIQWVFGLINEHPRSIARIYGLKLS